MVSPDGRNTSAKLDVVLSSSRRVKKGPGRRPQSAKRRRFMELRERGLSIDAAAQEVGVSGTAGRNWANGYRTFRSGEVVGFVAALAGSMSVYLRGSPPLYTPVDAGGLRP